VATENTPPRRTLRCGWRKTTRDKERKSNMKTQNKTSNNTVAENDAFFPALCARFRVAQLGIFALALALFIPAAFADGSPPDANFITPNDFTQGTQTERIAAAVWFAAKNRGKLVIPAIDKVRGSDVWLLDSAILLPSDFTLVLDNCKIKMSDRSRDNFIRTANLKVGEPKIKKYRNIHIIGIGNVLLEGADNPRASGDCFKQLSLNEGRGEKLDKYRNGFSYGTDAGKPDENQFGGWLNHGINIAATEGFSIKNITLRDYHGHGVIIADSCNGVVSGVAFDARGYIFINGKKHFVKNQDGFGIRQGCHDIIFENCTGNTGDDFMMIGAYFNDDARHGAGNQNTVSPIGDNRRGAVDDTYNIICRDWYNINAFQWKLIKLMASGHQKQYNLIFSNIVSSIDSRISFTRYKIDPGLHSNLVFENLFGKIRFVDEGGRVKNSVFRNIQYVGNADILGSVKREGDGHAIENVRNVTLQNKEN
jgi:hypothetical protein